MAESRVIRSVVKDLGGLQVRRALPSVGRRMVGPFVFFDHLGPVVLPAGAGIDVRPHPHIGLATVTYLFAGEIVHRDSLGCEQAVRPGDVNWMTAGRGIVHSERSGAGERARDTEIHGIQTWVALPLEHETVAPAFHHHPGATLPVLEIDGVTLRVIAGEAYGELSPVATFSPLFYLSAEFAPGRKLSLSEEYAERAVYVVEGVLEYDGASIQAGDMIVFEPGEVTLSAARASRALLLGGESTGRRHVWWNFVASSRERIETAKADWREGRFAPVPGDAEFIALPEGP